MPKTRLQTTEFIFSVLPSKHEHWARVKIAVKNKYISYADEGEYVSYDELEDLLSSLSRLLAGGYSKEQTISFEKAGIAVDLYAYTDGNREISRAERRGQDCVMAIRLLMRSKDKKSFLDGVYSLLFHRAEIETFVETLRAEYRKNCARHLPDKGKYLFAGVSPLGYVGCNYRYFDPTGETKSGDYVWVRMGRHDTEQIVYVDSVRWYGDDDAPYNPKTVKQVLRKATSQEIKEIK